MPAKGSSRSKKAGSKRRLDFDEEVPDSKAPVSASPAPSNSRSKRSKRQKPISFPPASATATPTKKSSKKAAVVTPLDADEKKTDDHSFVPIYIHKNVDYHTEGVAKISQPAKKAFELIRQTHIIPSDLQTSRAHGPLSGSCYEEKVMQEYELGQLRVKPEFADDDTATKICVACAKQGHLRDNCPDLL